MSEIEEKRGINSSNVKVLDGLQDLPCIPETNVIVSASTPTVILKNRVYSQKYSYTNKSVL